MFGLSGKWGSAGDNAGMIAALDRSMAVITFTTGGEILTANRNFLEALHYRLEDIVGRHHRMFVDEQAAASADYAAFWRRLAKGEFVSDQFVRIDSAGREVWIEATYNPILDRSGKPYRVVKFATVITDRVAAQANAKGQIAAINKSMAVIEFTPDGKILAANDLFLQATGYVRSELTGRHHGMFCSEATRESDEYREFWARLGKGQFCQGQYRRLAKGGREVWLEASYNPVFDARGRIAKVVKYATDITRQKAAEHELIEAVKETSAVVMAAKSGDLGQSISLSDKSGEIAALCGDVNVLLETTSGLIDGFGALAARIRMSSEQFARESARLAESAGLQSSSLQETAATTEELAASIKQTADYSRDVAQIGATTHHLAEEGTGIVREAVSAMERIEAASVDISSIVSIIDAIAFQTNLLALNAAVEAARAGEAGKGFAVVASEVRALAKRSAESAAGVRDLIQTATSSVHSGAQLVEQTGKRLAEIAGAAEGVSTAINEISRGTSEQARGVDAMAGTVARMDELTNENAEQAKRSAQIAAELFGDATALADMVGRYRLNGKEGRPRRNAA